MVNPQPSFTVRGQVRRSDNASIGSGFTVRAFDRLSATNEVPLGQPVPLQPNGTYQITYTWQSTGSRNGPALVVKVFNPQGQELASQARTVATRLETLDLTWNLPPQPQTFTLYCTIRNQATGDSLPNLRVEAIFRVTNKTILTHSGTTNAQGAVVIPFDRALFNNLPQGQSIEVVFQAYQGNQQLQTSTTIPNLQRENQKVEILVTVEPPQEEIRIVKGTIRQTDGLPIEGLIVRAFDCDHRSKQFLGQQATNPVGDYEIPYSRAQFRRTEKDNADLVLRIASPDNQEIQSVTFTTDTGKPLEARTYADSNGNEVRLSIWFQAPQVAIINATTTDSRYQGLSEHERNVNAITPLLEVPLHELVSADDQFFIDETNLPFDQIKFLRLDAQWSRTYEIPSALFYGLLRQGLPSTLRELLAEPSSRLREALKAALAANIIPQALSAIFEDILERLQSLAGQIASEPDQDASALPPLGTVLATAPLDPSIQEMFVRFVVAYEGETLWEDAQQIVGNEATQWIQFTLQSYRLTLGSLPVLQQLQQNVANPAVKVLAGWNEQDWLGVIEQANTNGNALPDGFKNTADYVQAIIQDVETWLPSDRLLAQSARVAQANPLEAVNLYAHLGLREISEAADFDNQTKETRIRERIELFNRFYRNNPQMDLRYVDLIQNQIYVNGEPQDLQWEGIPDTDRTQILNQARAFQRLMFVPDTKTRIQLLAAGFDSADKIANTPPASLTTTAQLLPDKANQVKEAAQETVWRTEQTRWWFNSILRDIPLRVGNQDPAVSSTFRELDTIQRLLGNQGFCDCSHCNSVLSQSAYFVDLMAFIEQHVSNNPAIFGAVGDARRNSPLYLPNRRPDLWQLELSCKNIHEQIPYLQVVIHIFEQHLIRHLSLRNRDELYSRLADPAGRSTFQQPFLLARDELRIYLSHFRLTPADIAQILGHSRSAYALIYLQIAQSELELISQADGNSNRVRSLYGLNTSDNINRIPMPRFMQVTELDRPVVSDLLSEIASARSESLASLVLRVTREEVRGSLRQQYDEFVTSSSSTQTVASLDLLHRWIRLWRKTGWTLATFDFILAQLHQAGLGTELGEQTIIWVAILKVLQDRWNFAVEELVSLFRNIPSPSTNSLFFREKGSFYHRLFGDNSFTGMIQFTNFDAERPAVTLSYPEAYRLLSGLNLSEADLIELLIQLRHALMPAGSNSTQSFPLSHENLSLLYRHALLARKLKRSPQSFFLTIRLILGPERVALTTLDDIYTLLDRSTELTDLPFSLAQLGWLVLDEDFEGRRSLLGSPQLTTLRQELSNIEDDEPLSIVIGSHFRWNQLTTEAILALTGVTRETLQTVASTSDDVSFRRLLLPLEKWHLLRDTFKLEPAHLNFIGSSATIFTRPEQPDLSLIHHLWLYHRLVSREEINLERAHELLERFAAGAEEEHVELSWLLESEISIIESLRQAGIINWSAHPLEALAQMKRAAVLCQKIGVNGRVLARIASLLYNEMQEGRNAILEAFRAKYPNDAQQAELLAPYQDRLLSLQRNGLVDYLLSQAFTATSPRMRFNDTFDLFSFFLMDPEMEGCARSSWVLAGISSLQLYVHRCLMNLEQESTSGGAAVQVPPSAIPQQEWAWRKHFRVWELNRKIFLNSSSFINPTLRDDKTLFFEELEDELFQQEISAESVETAYKNYLSKFLRVANLKIAGTYRDEPNQTLYIFGHTPDDPPQYYYRTLSWSTSDITHGVWSPWYPMDLTIKTSFVSPVVHRGKLHLFWLEIHTHAVREFRNGNAIFRGFRHQIKLLYSSINASGKWEPPTEIEFRNVWNRVKPEPRVAFVEGSDISYLTTYSGKTRIAESDFDSYTLRGYEWERIYPRTTPAGIRFYYRESIGLDGQMTPASAFHKISSVDKQIILSEGNVIEDWYYYVKAYLAANKRIVPLARLFQFGSLSPVNSKVFDFILTAGEESFLIDSRDYSSVITRRLGSSTGERLAEIFYEQGLEKFLSPQTQIDGREIHPSWANGNIDLRQETGHIDFTGACGIYYRELYFHLPFLIAHHLNANQKFAGAQQWYHYIFDPTAPETPDLARPADRNWRYVPFRNQTLPTLQKMLTDAAALEHYSKDPFNPYAIARLRPGEFQKAIVMAYIDNLLDWGDHLFTQFTYESVNEALLHYLMALDILGERPVKQGPCPEPESVTYGRISNTSNSDFVVLPENLMTSLYPEVAEQPSREQYASIIPNARGELLNSKALAGRGNSGAISLDVGNGGNINLGVRSHTALEPTRSIASNATATTSRQSSKKARARSAGKFTSDISRAHPVFCVPMNEHLLEYWDRVEDRLFKIRNCMDIRGLRRTLALYDPPIDPMLLVRAKAAGLTLDSVRGSRSQVPLHRFPVLLEKARSAATLVQSFGTALLSALEKKDGEELNLMRSTHERNILTLTRQVRQKQIQEAQHQRHNLEESRVSIENRRDYYSQLLETGLIEWERLQQVAQHTSTFFHGYESVHRFIAAVFHLIPEAGSPFAMKYGGRQVGDSFSSIAQAFGAIASQHSAIAASSGLEAGNQRRSEGWEFELKQAEQDLRQNLQLSEAAKLREEIAQRELEIFEKNVQQSEEQYEFIKDKFTRLGLYNWMVQHLTRLHREAYRLAYEIAEQAQQSYRFERADSSALFIEPTNWNQDWAGLLAAEQLQLQLQQIDQAYQRSNEREYELTKHISLLQLNPLAFIALKETGKCEIELPEVLFDLDYPGHYLRRIKSVSLTIPCVAGPYTNVSCKLTLISSETRTDGTNPDTPLVRDLYSARSSIATSTAQNDSGLFELNFRDERYLPFENAGVISRWSIELSGKWDTESGGTVEFPQFDFDTISDVVFHLRYTERDGAATLKNTKLENLQAALNQLTETAHERGLFRLFSLRHEFPTEWHRFQQSTSEDSLTLSLAQERFPFMFRGKTITFTSDDVEVYTTGGHTSQNVNVSVSNGGESVEIRAENTFRESRDVFLVCRYTVS